MNMVFRVFSYEIRRQARRTSYLFMSLGVPILALAIFFGVTAYQNTRGAANAGDTSLTKTNNLPSPNDLPTSLAGVVSLSPLVKAQEPIGNLVFYNSVDEAKDALKQGKIGFYYVIPASYEQNGNVELYVDRLGTVSTIHHVYLKQVLIKDIVSQLPTQPTDGQLARLQFSPTITTHSVTVEGSKQAANGDTVFALAYIFAMVLMICSFTTSGYLMQSVVEEKETRMIEVVISSMRPSQLLAGKILALSVLGIVQMFLWMGTAVFIVKQLANGILGGVPIPGIEINASQLVILSIYFVLGYLFFASAYAAIGALVTNMREGPQYAAFITIPAVVPFYATSLIASAPSGSLATFLSIFPLTAPLGMVMRASVSAVPIGEVVLSVVLLLLTVIFLMWLAGRFFRVNTLLSGQMPKFRDLLRLVRESS